MASRMARLEKTVYGMLGEEQIRNKERNVDLFWFFVVIAVVAAVEQT